MATHADPASLDADARRDRRHFLLRRLHSLTGIVPVGLFLAEHLWTNSKAIQGQTCFGNAIEEIWRLPFLPLIEILGIFLPLTFHALYGVKLAFESRVNVGRYSYPRNWLFTLQRVTGIITLIFLVFHLKDFRIAKLLSSTPYASSQFYGDLRTVLGSKPYALFYALGVTCAVFHFGNGIRTFLFGWGMTVSKKSQRYGAVIAASIGLALWFLGINTVLYFATGGVGGTFIPSSVVRAKGASEDSCAEARTPPAADAPAPAPAK